MLSDKNKKKIYDKSGLTASEQEDLEFTKSKENESVGTAGMFLNDIEEEEDGIMSTATKAKEDSEIHYDNQASSLQIFNRIADFYGNAPFAKESLYIGKENTHDIITDLAVSFIDSIKGCTKSVAFNRCHLCEECKGEFCL